MLKEKSYNEFLKDLGEGQIAEIHYLKRTSPPAFIKVLLKSQASYLVPLLEAPSDADFSNWTHQGIKVSIKGRGWLTLPLETLKEAIRWGVDLYFSLSGFSMGMKLFFTFFGTLLSYVLLNYLGPLNPLAQEMTPAQTKTIASVTLKTPQNEEIVVESSKASKEALEVLKDYVHFPGSSSLTLDDVIGLSQTKEELKEFLYYLKEPARYDAIGAKPAKGILLSGSPGSGKTMLAKGLAGSAGVPFIAIPGSIFDEIFVGRGADRVRALFAYAKALAPCIVFIDEIDAIGMRNTDAPQPGDNMTINQLLSEMDGLSSKELLDRGMLLFAATNHPKALDPALTRSGRFDRKITVFKPGEKERLEIMQRTLKKIGMQVDPAIDFKAYTKKLKGISSAELIFILNEGARKAFLSGKKVITLKDLEKAYWSAQMLLDQPMIEHPEIAKRVSTYHAGKALAQWYLSEIDESKLFEKPEAISMSQKIHFRTSAFSKASVENALIVLSAGSEAENFLYAKEDQSVGLKLEDAYHAKRQSILYLRLGFSEKLGLFWPLDKRELDSLGYWGFEPQLSNIPAPFKSLVEQEIRAMFSEARLKARTILQANRATLEKLAHELEDKETLYQEDLIKFFQANPLNNPYTPSDQAAKPALLPSSEGS